jgi:hypothetical protein
MKRSSVEDTLTPLLVFAGSRGGRDTESNTGQMRKDVVNASESPMHRVPQIELRHFPVFMTPGQGSGTAVANQILKVKQ